MKRVVGYRVRDELLVVDVRPRALLEGKGENRGDLERAFDHARVEAMTMGPGARITKLVRRQLSRDELGDLLALADHLALVLDVTISLEVLGAWSADQRGAAEEWAAAEYRATNDGGLNLDPMPLHVALAVGRARVAAWTHAEGVEVLFCGDDAKTARVRTIGAPFLLEDGTAAIELERVGVCALQRFVVVANKNEAAAAAVKGA